MKSDPERCKERESSRKIDAAFRSGDLAALRAAVDDPASVPNGPEMAESAGFAEIARRLAACELRLEK